MTLYNIAVIERSYDMGQKITKLEMIHKKGDKYNGRKKDIVKVLHQPRRID